MYFNNDDDNDFNGGDFKSLGDLLNEFNRAKNGESFITLNEDDYELLIDYFEAEGDKVNIKYAFEIAIAQFPFSSALLLRKCEWLTDQSKYGQALKLLDEIEALDHHNLEALLLRTDILIELTKYEEAIQILEASLPQYDDIDKIEIWLELSELYDTTEEFELVYKALKNVLMLDSKNEEAMLRICFWADVTNNQEDAITLYQSIIDEDPFNAVAWYNIGVAYQGIKMYEKAIDCYNYCTDLDEQFEYAYRNMGDAYIQLKQYDQAIDVLEKHLTYSKPEDIILEAIGDCWERKAEYGQARNYYRKASSLSPHDDMMFYKIGTTYMAENKWEKAIKNFQVAYEMNKDNANYSLALGDCLMKMEAFKESILCFVNAVRLKPSSKLCWCGLIKALYTCDYLDEAANQAIAAIEICGNKAEFSYYQAIITLAKGKSKEAKLLLEQAIMQWPKKIKCMDYLEPSVTLHPSFAEVIARYKKKK
jgi:tetratricopeptide (TPR) repeat protein